MNPTVEAGQHAFEAHDSPGLNFMQRQMVKAKLELAQRGGKLLGVLPDPKELLFGQHLVDLPGSWARPEEPRPDPQAEGVVGDAAGRDRVSQSKTVEEKLTFWCTVVGITVALSIVYGLAELQGHPTVYSDEAACTEATGQVCEFSPRRETRNWDGYSVHSSYWYPVEP